MRQKHSLGSNSEELGSASLFVIRLIGPITCVLRVPPYESLGTNVQSERLQKPVLWRKNVIAYIVTAVEAIARNISSDHCRRRTRFGFALGWSKNPGESAKVNRG